MIFGFVLHGEARGLVTNERYCFVIHGKGSGLVPRFLLCCVCVSTVVRSKD